MDVPGQRPAHGHAFGRFTLTIVVSLLIAGLATLEPAWTILALTVPIAAVVSVVIAQGIWQTVCIRSGAAVLLLGTGALAAQGETGGYAALVAVLPCALATLLFAMCSALTADEDPTRLRPADVKVGSADGTLRPAGFRLWTSLAACASALVAALLIVITGTDALFAQPAGVNLQPVAAQLSLSASSGADPLPFALLLVGAPALIIYLRLAVQWPAREARYLELSSVAAFGVALLCAVSFGPIRVHHTVLLLIEAVSNLAAFILMMQCVLTVSR